MSGVDTIAAAFAVARQERRPALMPYLMGGFPSVPESAAIGAAYAGGGADLVELGVPYSDPLADGGVIHAAGTRALGAGVRLDDVLAVGAEIADSVPVVLMCYVNLVLARGVERFCDGLAAAGISGLIVPDLPLEEAPSILAACDERGLALVPLVAPTTPEDRLEAIASRARGFIYLVSVRGTTGERAGVDAGLGSLVARTRSAAGAVPVAVGFGIGSPEQAAAAAAAGADGVIIGTRLVRAAGDGEDLAALVGSFAAALRGRDPHEPDAPARPGAGPEGPAGTAPG